MFKKFNYDDKHEIKWQQPYNKHHCKLMVSKRDRNKSRDDNKAYMVDKYKV